MKDIPFDPYDFFGYLSAGLVVLAALDLAFGVPDILGHDHKTLSLILIAFGAYIAGQIVASPAKFILEDVITRKVLGDPTTVLMTPADTQPWYRSLAPGYFTPLSESTRNAVALKAKNEGLTVLTGDALFEHIRFRDYVLADATLMARLQIFLIRYGFARNLSFVALTFATIAFLRLPASPVPLDSRYAWLSLATGVILFYRYLKFYRLYAFELLATYAGKTKKPGE